MGAGYKGVIFSNTQCILSGEQIPSIISKSNNVVLKFGKFRWCQPTQVFPICVGKFANISGNGGRALGGCRGWAWL